MVILISLPLVISSIPSHTSRLDLFLSLKVLKTCLMAANLTQLGPMCRQRLSILRNINNLSGDSIPAISFRESLEQEVRILDQVSIGCASYQELGRCDNLTELGICRHVTHLFAERVLVHTIQVDVCQPRPHQTWCVQFVDILQAFAFVDSYKRGERCAVMLDLLKHKHLGE